MKVSSVVGGSEDEEIDPREIELVVAEILRDEHEAFDEYLEMVIELGECLHLVRKIQEVLSTSHSMFLRLRDALCSCLSPRCAALPRVQHD